MQPVAVAQPASVGASADLQSAFKRAIAAAGPGVVSVYSRVAVRPGSPEPEYAMRGMGSGFVIDAEGFILTNNHVVEGSDALQVKFPDGQEFDATVVGTDPPTDVAVLKVEAQGLHPIAVGNSRALEVGDWVLAIGNPFDLPQTVSSGIVSAKGRANVGIVDYEDFIQTDAAVNPGNSGGPLVDLEGRVVGINTAIASRSGSDDGIAFAIPIHMAMEVAGDLRTSARAGLTRGDIVTRFNGDPVTDMTTFRTAVAHAKPGTNVSLGVWREGEDLTLHAVLGQAPQVASAARHRSAPQRNQTPDARHDLRISLRLGSPRSSDL